MSSSDDLFGGDRDLEAFAEEMDRHGHEIHEFVTTYLDEHDISEGVASHMMLSLAINLRMLAYGLETAKPSASGLKIDLDRFGREIEEVIRDTKKHAEEFIAEIKAALADGAEDEDEHEDEHEDKK